MDEGNNYIDPPAIRILGGGGTGATAIAQISAGAVVGFKVLDAGHGYTSMPEVRIGSPRFEPTITATTNVTRFKLTADLTPNASYAFETSGDLTNWSSFIFTPETPIFSMNLSPTGSANFVRLKLLP